VILACFVLMILFFPPMVALAARAKAAGWNTRTVVTVVAVELVLVGYLLTPGLAWGKFHEHPTVNAIGSTLWLAGFAMLLVALVRWARTRRARSRS
jgi:hypothetical protein